MASLDTRVDSKIFWDIKKTLSHNCLFNFILSIRGGGKTYGVLKWCIEKHLSEKRNGRSWQFVYVRRHENELKKLTIQRNGRIFKSVRREFPTHQLKAESNVLYCDKEEMGYAIQLSTAMTSKSDPMPDVHVMIFDEFITGVGKPYLRDEVTQFLELYESVARPGTDHPEVKVFFLGNPVNPVNPYFDYFGLERPYMGEFRKFGDTKDILVQDVDVPELAERKKSTRFGKIIDGTTYAGYSQENKWLEGTSDFIAHKTKDSEYRMSIRYEDDWIGVWFDVVEWVYYISNSVELQNPNKFAATTKDHKPNAMLMKSAKQMGCFKHLINAYNIGCVRFESMKLKDSFKEIMRMMNAR